MRVAILTPLAVPGLSSGWHEVGGHQVLVIAGHGNPVWPGQRGHTDQEELFDEFAQLRERGRLDQIITFLSADGCDRVIDALAYADQTELKIMYCDCRVQLLLSKLVNQGVFGETWLVGCNGGQQEMRSLLRKLALTTNQVAA